MKPNVWTNVTWKPHQKGELERVMHSYTFESDATKEEVLQRTEVVIHWTNEMDKLFEAGKLPNLKWVQAISAGVNALPLDAFQEQGIILTNASGIHASTITEYVMGMILYYTKGFKKVVEQQQNHEWSHSDSTIELRGKTMMIYGAGKIGSRLASVAHAFGMGCIGVNRSGRSVDKMDLVVRQEESDQWLKEADVVVSILPDTVETDGFFHQKRFEQVKNGMVFINVGRGNAVDEEALLHALDTGKVAFAGLDVFRVEPLPSTSPLWNHPNVFVSPHQAGMLEHFRDELSEIVETNVESFLHNGKPSKNVIDYLNRY